MLIAYILNKRDELNFPIVNFPFIFNNIPAAPVYEYISLNGYNIPDFGVLIRISLIED